MRTPARLVSARFPVGTRLSFPLAFHRSVRAFALIALGSHSALEPPTPLTAERPGCFDAPVPDDLRSPMTPVGFLGLGSQGAPMARRVVDDGYPLTVWARRASTLEPFGDSAAAVAATPADLGAASDIVELCVVA